MNLDVTFCHPKDCKKRGECFRWLENLIMKAKESGINIDNRRISVADFSKQECKMFISKNDK